MAWRVPPGYLSKSQAAERLGMSTKTLDRRTKTEPALGRVTRKGRQGGQVLFPIEVVEAYAQLAEKRGHF